MTIFNKIIRCLCMCVTVKRGSWTPENNERQQLNDKKQKQEKELKKPEWLKQWTISKGWMHNRSHMLSIQKETSQENLIMEPSTSSKIKDREDSSSVSLENIDDLISVISNAESSIKSKPDMDKIEVLENENNISLIFTQVSENYRTKFSEKNQVKNKKEVDVDRIEIVEEENDVSVIFSQVSENYRDNFPERYYTYSKNSDLSLPEVYKERLLSKADNENIFVVMLKALKPKRKPKKVNGKYTVNELYDAQVKPIETYKNYSEQNLDFEECSSVLNKFPQAKEDKHKSTLGQNIALYNTLNAKTNLHEDTIYECSEESLSLYNNPIYVSGKFDKSDANEYFFNRLCNKGVFAKNRDATLCNRKKHDALKQKLKTEKYIIRHIKIRIMLTLRVSKLRFYRKDVRSDYKHLFRGSERAKFFRSDFGDCVGEDLRVNIAKTHEEQRRIGNGKTSIKIQNMRYML